MTEALPLTEYVPDLIWLKEHQLSIMGGALRTRMTVLRLDGGLCIHSPVVIDDLRGLAVGARVVTARVTPTLLRIR